MKYRCCAKVKWSTTTGKRFNRGNWQCQRPATKLDGTNTLCGTHYKQRGRIEKAENADLFYY